METTNTQTQNQNQPDITTMINQKVCELAKNFLSEIETNKDKKAEKQEANREQQRIAYKKAMVKAMKKMPPNIPTNKIVEKPNGQKYAYADLSSIIEATKQTLTENGFYVEFRFRTDPIQKTVNTIMLINHEDGWVNQSEPFTLRVNTEDPQSIASAITYSKRYLYCAMLNISADSDDDGSAASSRQNNKITDKQETKQFPEPPKNAPTAKIQNTKKETTSQPTKNAGNTQISIPNLIPPQKPEIIKPKPIVQPNKQTYKCADCGKEITEDEARYSTRTFQKPYCLDCQPKHKPVIQQQPKK